MWRRCGVKLGLDHDDLLIGEAIIGQMAIPFHQTVAVIERLLVHDNSKLLQSISNENAGQISAVRVLQPQLRLSDRPPANFLVRKRGM